VISKKFSLKSDSGFTFHAKRLYLKLKVKMKENKYEKKIKLEFLKKKLGRKKPKIQFQIFKLSS